MAAELGRRSAYRLALAAAAAVAEAGRPAQGADGARSVRSSAQTEGTNVCARLPARATWQGRYKACSGWLKRLRLSNTLACHGMSIASGSAVPGLA
eukprot:scaffold1280_cov379-Prasinococcus_capsulatus_cf.AAC.5